MQTKSQADRFASTVQRAVLVLYFCVLTFSHFGCATTTRTAPVRAVSGNVQRLANRPDTDAAIKAAPEWCRDALHTIVDLETQLKEARAK